jgi:uroporphyrinogen-III synthase
MPCGISSTPLRAAGVAPALIVEPAAESANFDSEALWAQLSALAWGGRRVLVVRGEAGRDWLADELRARGAEVGFVAAYRRQPPVLDDDARALLAAALAAPMSHLWVFSSSEAVGHLGRLVPAADWSRSRAVASHPRIVQAARDAGFGSVDLVRPAPEALAALLTPPSIPPSIQSAPL